MIQVDTFSADCVPAVYRMTFNGPGALRTTGGGPVDVVFDGLETDVNDTGDPIQVAIDGALEAACYGGRVTLQSNPTLLLPDASICPTAGGVDLTTPQGSARAVYRGRRFRRCRPAWRRDCCSGNRDRYSAGSPRLPVMPGHVGITLPSAVIPTRRERGPRR